MAHTTQVVKMEKINSSQWVATIRCCNDASTDFPANMADSVVADPKEKKRSLGEAHKIAADNHQKMLDAEAGAVDSLGETVKHK